MFLAILFWNLIEQLFFNTRLLFFWRGVCSKMVWFLSTLRTLNVTNVTVILTCEYILEDLQLFVPLRRNLNLSTEDTHHSSEGWGNEPAVDGNKTATDQCLWTERGVKQEQINFLSLTSMQLLPVYRIRPAPGWVLLWSWTVTPAHSLHRRPESARCTAALRPADVRHWAGPDAGRTSTLWPGWRRDEAGPGSSSGPLLPSLWHLHSL